MKYFLKIWGNTYENPKANILSDYEKNGGAFWKENTKVWFGKSNIGGKVEIGDILIQYIPLGQPQKEFAGRVVGYYKVESDFKYENLLIIGENNKISNSFYRYVEVKNLNVPFSERSKNRTILHIKKVINKFPASIQAGYARLTEEQAKYIINLIDDMKIR